MPRLFIAPAVTRFVFGLAVLVALTAFPRPALAVMTFGTGLAVDFTKPAEAAANATWSDSLSLDASGLGWDAPATADKAGWFQTRPLSIGAWWRPLPSVRVSVEITPSSGDVFVRYSADKQHWSSWQVLDYQAPPGTHDTSPRLVNGVITPPPDTSPVRFTGTLKVPHRDREAYLRRRKTYSRLDVPWVSDENALAHWIVAKEPDFFAHHIPFVGYMEFLFENDFAGGQRIASVKVSADGAISGMHVGPRDPAMKKALSDISSWRFPDPPAPDSGEAAK